MKIYCKVTAQGLVPMYDSDYDEKKRLKEGETVLCEISKPRNYEFHKKFMSLVRLTFDNLPNEYLTAWNIYSEEDMLTRIKIDLGLYTLAYIGRKTIVKPGSISFAKMDETEFEKFYNRTIDLIIDRYLAGTNRDDLLEIVSHYK